MKHNLFDELNEGFMALKSEREGKITLKHHNGRKKAQAYNNAGRVINPARTTAFVAVRVC
jgi:hypothetical protein